FRALRDVVHTDYVAFATAGRIAATNPACLYCGEVQRATQIQLLGFDPQWGVAPFVNPAPVAWIMVPLASHSLRAGAATFLVLSLAALAVAAWMLMRWRPLIVATTRGERAAIVACSVTLVPGAEA